MEEILKSESVATEDIEAREMAISHALLTGQLGDDELLDNGCHLSSASLKKLYEITDKAQKDVQREKEIMKEKELHLAQAQEKLDHALTD